MAKLFVQIDDVVLEADDEKVAYLESWIADIESENARALSERTAKEESKKSAIAKLTALGLTEQEVFDLLGIIPENQNEPIESIEITEPEAE
jgi:hypothetical protein